MLLNQIEEAAERLKGVAHHTPVFTSRYVNRLSGKQIFFKTENFQIGGAFKIRGAYNTISQLDANQKQQGIITHSSGNHAQAVAISGRLLDIPTTIVMPRNAPKVKIQATRDYGADVVLCDSSMEAREATCQSLIDQHGYTLVHPYDNDHIIAGAATASMELVTEVGNMDAVIAPVGGGGLLSGTGLYSKLSGTCPIVLGAEPEGANDAYMSFTTGTRVTEQVPNTIADGLRTTLSERTFNYILRYIDGILTVNDEQILEAMKIIWQRMKIIVEPSGAVPLAAVLNRSKRLEGIERIGLIISGGNVDVQPYFDKLVNH